VTPAGSFPTIKVADLPAKRAREGLGKAKYPPPEDGLGSGC